MDKSGYDSLLLQRRRRPDPGRGEAGRQDQRGAGEDGRGRPARRCLISNCPFCLTMFEDGIKTGGAEGRLQARDLAEIVAERL